jgi:GDP-L-fucose synthase
MKEEHLLTGELEPTNEPYAIAKIAGIKMCQAYNRQYGTHFISAMPTNLYGPNDNFDLKTSHVLPALIRKMHLGKCLESNDWEALRADLHKRPIDGVNGKANEREILEILKKYGIVHSAESMEHRARSMDQGEQNKGQRPAPCTMPHANHHASNSTHHATVTLWGTGTPKREFLSVADLADACLFLMLHYDESQFINVGVGEDISIKDLALLIKNIVGYQGELIFDTSKPDGTPRKLLDVSRLKALGWQPKIGLREGIKQTYQWYLDHNK